MKNKLNLGALLVLLAAYGCAAPYGTTGSIDIGTTPMASAVNWGSSLPNGKLMPASNIAAPLPVGFVSFCTRFPDQCQAAKDAPSTVTLAPAQWLALEEVNEAVNRAIKPMDDQQHYGRAEYWNIPTDGYGDCEDYALTKRRDLMAAGFPAPALRIAVVVTSHNERHAVLTVVTDRGDYVLDNLTSTIRNWDSTDYQWIERQDPNKAWGWVSLDKSQSPALVASAASGPVSTIN